MLRDLAGTVSVRQLDTKTARKSYVRTLREALPAPNSALPEPVALTGPEAAPKRKQPREKKPTAADRKPLYDGLELTNLGERVAALLRELKMLKPEQFPNATAVLNRVLMELAVGQILEDKKKQGLKLRDGVKFCLTRLDPTNKNRKFQAVRNGLQDGTSMLSVQTMHALVHNPDWHPVASDIRAIARNYTPFLAALDTLV
jgi:hypothetical protein